MAVQGSLTVREPFLAWTGGRGRGWIDRFSDGVGGVLFLLGGLGGRLGGAGGCESGCVMSSGTGLVTWLGGGERVEEVFGSLIQYFLV